MAFTPECKAVTLPKGATALDFAYAVDLGDHARYARINGRLSSLPVREGTPAEGAVAIGLSKRGKLNPGKVFVTFQEARTVSEKAVVKVYWDKGSLMDGSYEVDPSTRTRWRIGRGQTSNRQDYSFRTNEIVIRTDDPDEEIQALNNHVSSAHADLVYREGRYYLQVLPSGSVAGSNSTRIIRDQPCTDAWSSATGPVIPSCSFWHQASPW